MANNPQAKVPFISPKGFAKYPHLTAPDTKGQYADNKYKTKLRVPVKDAAPFVAQIDEFMKGEFGSKASRMYVPYTETDDGFVEFNFKSTYKPAVFDARNNEVTQVPMIGGGSTIRVAGVISSYDKGCNLRLNQVQVLELRSGGGESRFDADDEGSFAAGGDTGGFGDHSSDDDGEYENFENPLDI